MNLNLDFISEKFGDGKVAELNLSPKMGTMVKNIQKPLAFIQKKVKPVTHPESIKGNVKKPVSGNNKIWSSGTPIVATEYFSIYFETIVLRAASSIDSSSSRVFSSFSESSAKNLEKVLFEQKNTKIVL